MKLIIVESPAKARTIERFLGDDYEVAASYGHIRDLPSSAREIPQRYRDESWSRLGVDPDGGFQPIYIVPADSKKHVAELKKRLRKADELLLATDEDREGEAISWHLLQVLEPQVPVRRITFHEITRTAIEEALASPRRVNDQLVRAQESRRILDRLYGYSLSPVLWKKVRTKLSAGRVQSVAVRLVVEREEERRAFHTAEYYDVEALLIHDDLHFTARLASIDGRRIAGGRDFDATTGALKDPEQRWRLDGAQAEEVAAAALRHVPWTASSVERRSMRQRPAPPFITSTLQQAGSRRLRWTPTQVMRIAQRLYEGIDLGGGRREGLITYMRTDSTTLSEKALKEMADHIRAAFGPEYTEGPRRYRTSTKGAQEAHEAIRPTDVRRTPDDLADVLEARELALYRMIWNRAVASQMTDAQLDKTAVDFTVAAGDHEYVFRATGSIVRFPGHLRLYGDAEKDSRLPELRDGQKIGGDAPEVQIHQVTPLRHETSPPARYTEATLVRKLEEEGIGRPSTYAPVIQTIQDRGYVHKKSGALLPTYIGIAVTRLLRDHFPRYVDIAFTAEMEGELDDIARGDIDWVEFLREFYRGSDSSPGLVQRIDAEMERIGYPSIPLGEDPATGRPLQIRVGRNYVYVEVEGDDERRAPVPVDLLIDELTVDKALELIEARTKLQEPIGQHPETGENVYVRTGPYGPYVQLGDNDGDSKPRRVSLGRDTDPASVELELALKLLSLPRIVGKDPESGREVRAGLGRYGPYVECNRVFASLDSIEQIFAVDLPRALDRIRNKNRKPVLKELGAHPETGADLQILKGRYGPYVTDGTVNATLGRGRSVEETTLADAVDLLAVAAERQRDGKTTRRRAAKKDGAGTKAKAAKKKTAGQKKTGKKTARKKTANKKKAGEKVAKETSRRSRRKTATKKTKKATPSSATGDSATTTAPPASGSDDSGA